MKRKLTTVFLAVAVLFLCEPQHKTTAQIVNPTPPTTVKNCGATSACAGTAVTNPIIEISGAVTSDATGVLTITGLSFTSTTSYVCVATGEGTGTIATAEASYISGSSVKFSTSAVSAPFRYICIGN